MCKTGHSDGRRITGDNGIRYVTPTDDRAWALYNAAIRAFRVKGHGSRFHNLMTARMRTRKVANERGASAY